MQQELAAEETPVPIRILGVNASTEASGNDLICEGRTIPWLQDNETRDAWNQWQVTWRDVVVLDQWNHPVTVFNLTAHDLAQPQWRDSLVSILRGAAGVP